MALFNKLFASRRKNYNKYQENVCDKLFTFSNGQVRVVLFRECDFRGRKLLFDSQTIQKVPLVNQIGQQETNNASSYTEVSNGYKYVYAKPNADVTQLGEMIFGSVAMSYRGTSYKIHSLALPPRLMCTQVFPSPRHSDKMGRNSAPSRSYIPDSTSAISSQSLEHSVHLDDSSTSCTSFSDQSLNSTASDTLLVCKRNCSVPLDVPQTNSGVTSNIPNSSLITDSGFCGAQSYGSALSGPHSVPLWDTNNEGLTFSCGSLYKRWLRSASTSLEYSASSLTGSASADECLVRRHPRTSKLGLAVIIQFTNGQEKKLEQFLMDHAALMEAMVWRVRRGAEIAYIRHNSFVSLMYEVTVNTAQWFVNFFCGPKLNLHLWLSLSANCDNTFSINLNKTLKNGNNNKSESVLARTFSVNNLDSSRTSSNITSSINSDLTNSCETTCSLDKGNEFMFLNITKLFKSDESAKKTMSSADKDFVGEKFVRELCELLESVDVKHTNFFISTVITAVLTHHLGWVATSLSPSQEEKDKLLKIQKTGNPLWGQLNDLYGAVGHPTKMACTVITGSNKSELIIKILNTLTYFIRCNDVERKCVSRVNTDVENTEVDRICHDKSCIPKENYKRYEDHLKEIAVINVSCKQLELTIQNEFKLKNESVCELEQKQCSSTKLNTKSDLNKTYTCLSQLNNEESSKLNVDMHVNKTKSHHDTIDKVTSLGLQAIHSPPLKNEIHFSNERSKRKINTLCRVPKSSVLCHLDEHNNQNSLIDINNANEQVEKVFNMKKYQYEEQRTEYKPIDSRSIDENIIANSNKNVIFVLGDDDELVNIKKDHHKLENPVTSIDRKKDLHCSLKRNKKFIVNNPKSSLALQFEKDEANNLDSHNPKLDCPSTPNIPKKNYEKFFQSADDEENKDSFKYSEFNDSDFIKYGGTNPVKPSTSWSQLEILEYKNKSPNFETQGAGCSVQPERQREQKFSRSKSEPPDDAKISGELKPAPRFKYAGVKFNFQQHSQIFKNYMRSKNIELSNLTFAEKAIKFQNGLSTTFDFTDFQGEIEEALQTPSNASELDFTNELSIEKPQVQKAKEILDPPIKFVRDIIPNTVIKESTKKRLLSEEISNSNELGTLEDSILTKKPDEKLKNKMELIELPMPNTKQLTNELMPVGYTCSLFRGVSEHYISDMVLQGIASPKALWEATLRKDLSLAARHPLLDQPIEEAVAIVANTDTWEVQLMSSHTYVIDKGSSGVRVGMSQLVANMLESLLHMWKLHAPPEHCIMHIEQRLHEFCLQSKALAELLLATDFCSMDLLTSSLQLEVNDVPLLMAVASTHSPQITQKYGLSFQ